LGLAELGYVSLEEVQSLKGPFGLRVERDMHFIAKHPLSVYTEAARLKGGITESPDTLEQVANTLKNRQP
jgi:hypothetical protein